MKIDLVFLIVLGFVVAYIFMLHKVETMADVGTTDQIKAAVKEIYLADVEAIRNLSNVATKLQAGGIGVPGNLIMKGPILTDHNIPHPDAGDGAIYRAEGQLTVAADDLIRFRSSSKKQNTIEMNVNDGSLNLTGSLNVNGKLITPNGHTIESVGRQHISGSELLYLLNKSGVIIGKEWGGNGNLQVQGELNVTGPIKGKQICLGGTCIDESHLQMLTGARSVALKHTSGLIERHTGYPWVHINDAGALAKYDEPSRAYFALFKN